MEFDASTTAQVHPLSNPHHRKIELQSPLDLTYLQANLSRCAQEKLDLHFPRAAAAAAAAATNTRPAEFISLDGPRTANSASVAAIDTSTSTQPPPPPSSTHNHRQTEAKEEKEEPDPLRAHVHTLLTAFLSRTWANALPSISINGLDAPPSLVPDPSVPATQAHQSGPREEIEGIDYMYTAFDGKLQQRVASLYAEVEALTAQVSRLRREAPARAAAGYADALRAAMEGDDDVWQRQQQQQQQQQQGEDTVMAKPGLELEEVRSGWHDDVESMYERGVDELVRLAGLKRSDGGGGGGGGDGSLTETVGKVQRARSVAMEFE